jgi:hypothetical protein
MGPAKHESKESLPPAKIEVEALAEGQFRVRIVEANSESSHRVTLGTRDYERIAGREVSPEKLVRVSFEFLLERESKESILAQFDLAVIGRYFPEYESEIRRRL